MSCTLEALTRYFFRLGALGFGGPIALTGYMRRDLVETRQWITEGICTSIREDEGRIAAATPMLDALYAYFTRSTKGDRR